MQRSQACAPARAAASAMSLQQLLASLSRPLVFSVLAMQQLMAQAHEGHGIPGRWHSHGDEALSLALTIAGPGLLAVVAWRLLRSMRGRS